MVEVVLVDKRGQMVVPLKLRKELGIEHGGALAVDTHAGTMVAERIKTPTKEDLLMRWNKMTKEWNKKALALGIKEEDVDEIIHRRRAMKD